MTYLARSRHAIGARRHASLTMITAVGASLAIAAVAPATASAQSTANTIGLTLTNDGERLLEEEVMPQVYRALVARSVGDVHLSTVQPLVCGESWQRLRDDAYEVNCDYTLSAAFTGIKIADGSSNQKFTVNFLDRNSALTWAGDLLQYRNHQTPSFDDMGDFLGDGELFIQVGVALPTFAFDMNVAGNMATAQEYPAVANTTGGIIYTAMFTPKKAGFKAKVHAQGLFATVTAAVSVKKRDPKTGRPAASGVMAFGVDRIVQVFLGEQKQVVSPAFALGSFTFVAANMHPSINVTDWSIEGGFKTWLKWIDRLTAHGMPLFEGSFDLLVGEGIQLAEGPGARASAKYLSTHATDLLKDMVKDSLRNLVTLEDQKFDFAVQGATQPVKATSTFALLDAHAVGETLVVRATMATAVPETNKVPTAPAGKAAAFTGISAGGHVDGALAPDLLTTFLTKLARGGIFDGQAGVTGVTGRLLAQKVSTVFDAKQGRGLTHTTVALQGPLTVTGVGTRTITASVNVDIEVDEECAPGVDLSFVGVEATALSGTGVPSLDLALRTELTRRLRVVLSPPPGAGLLSGNPYRSVPLFDPNVASIPNAEVWASQVRNTASVMTLGLRIGDQPSLPDRCLGTLARAVRTMLQINDLITPAIGFTDPSPILVKGLQTRYADLIARGIFDVKATSTVLGASASFGFVANGAAVVRALTAQAPDAFSTLEIRIPMALTAEVQVPLVGTVRYTGLQADYLIHLDAVRTAGKLSDLRTRDGLVDNIRLPGIPSNLLTNVTGGLVSAFTSGMTGRLYPR